MISRYLNIIFAPIKLCLDENWDWKLSFSEVTWDDTHLSKSELRNMISEIWNNWSLEVGSKDKFAIMSLSVDVLQNMFKWIDGSSMSQQQKDALEHICNESLKVVIHESETTPNNLLEKVNILTWKDYKNIEEISEESIWALIWIYVNQVWTYEMIHLWLTADSEKKVISVRDAIEKGSPEQVGNFINWVMSNSEAFEEWGDIEKDVPLLWLVWVEKFASEHSNSKVILIKFIDNIKNPLKYTYVLDNVSDKDTVIMLLKEIYDKHGYFETANLCRHSRNPDTKQICLEYIWGLAPTDDSIIQAYRNSEKIGDFIYDFLDTLTNPIQKIRVIDAILSENNYVRPHDGEALKRELKSCLLYAFYNEDQDISYNFDDTLPHKTYILERNRQPLLDELKEKIRYQSYEETLSIWSKSDLHAKNAIILYDIYKNELWAEKVLDRAIRVAAHKEDSFPLLVYFRSSHNFHALVVKIFQRTSSKTAEKMFRSDLMSYYFSTEETEQIRREAFPIKDWLEDQLLNRSAKPLRHLFREDPALIWYDSLDTKLVESELEEQGTLKWMKRKERDFTIGQWNAKILRYLHDNNITIDSENIIEAIKHILSVREKYDNFPIFWNTIYIANNEHWSSSDFFIGESAWKPRFVNERTLTGIKEEIHEANWYYNNQWSLNVISPSTKKVVDIEWLDIDPKKDSSLIAMMTKHASTSEDLKKAKQDTLKALTETQPPMTTLFRWHGSREAFYFSDGEVLSEDQVSEWEAVKITNEEISEALIARYSNPEVLDKISKTRPDVIILWNCFSFDHINKIRQKLTEAWVPHPIFLWPSEYGQYWFSNAYSEYWSEFLERLIFKNDSEGATTIRDIIDWDLDFKLPSNPSLFLPDEKNWSSLQAS